MVAVITIFVMVIYIFGSYIILFK
ncbi:hypothetical protein [Latilactobacillus phage TMW 1.1397 P1]|nr:hypothetical protein [Latilactobacillus phage TMW 1.1397 P1]